MNDLLNNIEQVREIVRSKAVSKNTTPRLESLRQAQLIADTYRGVKEVLSNEPTLTYSQGKEFELVLAEIMAIRYGGCGPHIMKWYELV